MHSAMHSGRSWFTALGLIAGLFLNGAPAARADDTVTLRMSHQWPDDPNDYVVSTGKQFVSEVEKRSGGKIKINVFPAESLVKGLDTHSALRNGSTDLAIYPYIYSAGAIPEMNIVLLPGLWKKPQDVFRLQDVRRRGSRGRGEGRGVRLQDGLLDPDLGRHGLEERRRSTSPGTSPATKVRAAGKMMEAALQKAGASTVSMSSTESYSAMQLGRARRRVDLVGHLRLVPPLRGVEVLQLARGLQRLFHDRAHRDQHADMEAS